MQATVKMTRAGQVSIPIEIRKIMGLKAGCFVTIDILSKEEEKKAEQGNSDAPCPA